MPPKRTSAVPPSPARSTRSISRARGDDDWDNDSMVSTSFKAPNARGKSNTSLSLGLVDTSVNVANAFQAAKSGHLLPTTPLDYSFASSTSSRKAVSQPRQPSAQPARPGSQRAQSPSEQLASSARALSPARFFLRSTDDDARDDPVTGGAYASFSSFANTSGGTNGNHSGETSYDYQQEEEFVRQAKAQQSKKGPKASSPKKRRGKALAEDLPYRPAEDDEVYDSDDSGEEGEGLVRSGALNGRSETRGKRQETGEGYLGMGLGIQQRQSTNGVANGARGYDGADGDVLDSRYEREYTPTQQTSHVSGNRYQRSPTPAQLLRALSPRVDRRSPVPTFQSRKRQPSSLRTVITNILHGLVLGLRLIVETVTHILQALLRPGESLLRLGRTLLRRLQSDWWKWLGSLFALSIAVRIMTAPWQPRVIHHTPEPATGSFDEVAARLSSLEQFTSDLSEMMKRLNMESGHGGPSQSMLDRMSDLESAVRSEKQRVDLLKGDGGQRDRDLHTSYVTLRRDVDGLVQRVDRSDSALSKAQARIGTIDNVEREVQSLRNRVGQVERQVKDALDDGRLRSALEKILPDLVPMRVGPRGEMVIDPKFWTEMKKVMMGRTETEALVKKALAQGQPVSSAVTGKSSQKAEEVDESRVRAWAYDVFERRSVERNWMSKDMFQDLLNDELRDLRAQLTSLKSQPPSSSSHASAPRSGVTIKSDKGDDLTSLFNELIDTALLKYSKDTIARTDYALFTAGARVIPHLTSDTLVLSTASKVGKWVMGSKDVQGRPPATALHPDISVGSCWPFAGEQGSLGVMLTRRVRVSDITIEHAPRELALDTSTAPKNIEVIGLVDNDADKAKLSEFWADRGETDKDANYLPLGTITYDTSSIAHIQTFPVSSQMQELDIKVGVVIVKVESNWGGKFTCLYRVRVHGEAE
ncbi:hypothetical protein IAU60_002187 [Kwoniella sp. DSM 27419]